MGQANELRNIAAFVVLIAPSLGKRRLNVLEGFRTRNLQKCQRFHKRCREMYSIIVLLLRKIRYSSEILYGGMVICKTAGF